MLKIQNLTKIYDGGVQALTDVSFDVPKGQFLAVIGLSGSGKSTLLRCINRLIEPTAGKDLLERRRCHGCIRRGTAPRPPQDRHGVPALQPCTPLPCLDQCACGASGICQSGLEPGQPLPKKRCRERLQAVGAGWHCRQSPSPRRRTERRSTATCGVARAMMQNPGNDPCG
jgi:energy-coupling factor transporter ATP-binding protein EcfA2